MINHNPKNEIEQLQRILSSPLKKIGFLFGAGISMQKTDGADLIIGMDDVVTKDSGGNEIILKKGMTSRATEGFSAPQKEAIVKMRVEIEKESKKFNIENLLSKISEKERAANDEKLCGLLKEELKKLRLDIENKIKEIVSVHVGSDKIDIEKTNHNTFAKWVKNADREFPVEVFTTNYDYLLELALEKQQIPYFDGFIGSYEAFFCPEWIEADSPVKDWTKLWKLHGSLGWDQNNNKEIIRTSGAAGKAMIYPSFLKYDHSKKQPYLSYMDRLSYFLRQEDSVLFVCGYSFGDEHINEMILTSLTRSRSSQIFVFKKGELKEEDLLFQEIAQKNSQISVYAKKSAVVGCKLGDWKLPSKEAQICYYKEDKLKTADDWDGKGELLLGNFKDFTDFLSDFYKKNNG